MNTRIVREPVCECLGSEDLRSDQPLRFLHERVLEGGGVGREGLGLEAQAFADAAPIRNGAMDLSQSGAGPRSVSS